MKCNVVWYKIGGGGEFTPDRELLNAIEITENFTIFTNSKPFDQYPILRKRYRRAESDYY